MRKVLTTILPVAALAVCVSALLNAAPPEANVAEAAMNGDTTTIRTLIKQGADVNSAQGDGTTALHWAALKGNVELAKMLLYAGANPRSTTRLGGYTALLMASRNGDARDDRRAAVEWRGREGQDHDRRDAVDVRGRVGTCGRGESAARQRRRCERERERQRRNGADVRSRERPRRRHPPADLARRRREGRDEGHRSHGVHEGRTGEVCRDRRHGRAAQLGSSGVGGSGREGSHGAAFTRWSGAGGAGSRGTRRAWRRAANCRRQPSVPVQRARQRAGRPHAAAARVAARPTRVGEGAPRRGCRHQSGRAPATKRARSSSPRSTDGSMSRSSCSITARIRPWPRTTARRRSMRR